MEKPSLISATILFRHGARGPGDSELSAWDASDCIVTQWNECELENLSSNGVQQIGELGKWFALRYLGKSRKMISSPKPFFRGSISDRAVESARDFVVAFNRMAGFEVCNILLQLSTFTCSLYNYYSPYISMFHFRQHLTKRVPIFTFALGKAILTAAKLSRKNRTHRNGLSKLKKTERI
jgi:hypothetical protein